MAISMPTVICCHRKKLPLSQCVVDLGYIELSVSEVNENNPSMLWISNQSINQKSTDL